MITSRILCCVPFAFPFALHAVQASDGGSTPASSRVADLQRSPALDRVHLQGWIGARVAGNEAHRLVRIDTDRLLEGYRKRPGRQTWDGEHVGKWLHAATLAWANTGDPVLLKKLEETVAALGDCQSEDGYLGTYLERDRWTEWDVWAHKYNLIGLLTYMHYTGDRSPLPVCVKMGDLLCRTFGDDGAKRDIIASGHHGGLASTSVLEPMVLLYGATGDPRYLAFCQYLVRAWEQPNGPHIISRLLAGQGVDKVGNGKAYEMLSCLNGALELHRVTGDPKLLHACLNAWHDIVDHRLYITGTASYGEHFHDDYDLPNRENVAETCVTVTWLQFNAHLLHLTGEARFAEELERTVMNQLFGAQQPDCTAWGYYVEMEGRKPYSATLDANCCLSSGPRGVALIPTFAAGGDHDGVVVNLYTTLQASLALADGTPVRLSIETGYPRDGRILVRVAPSEKKEFSVKLRIPVWAECAELEVNGQPAAVARGRDGYAALQRAWVAGDEIELVLPLEPRVIVGDHNNEGKLALAFGPLILAADEAFASGGTSSIEPPRHELRADVKVEDEGRSVAGSAFKRLALGAVGVDELGMRLRPATNDSPSVEDRLVFDVRAVRRDPRQPTQVADPVTVGFRPFAEAGESGSEYRVWMPVFGAPAFNIATLGVESRSRSMKNTWGHAPSIIDGSKARAVLAQGGTAPHEDWFQVDLPAAIEISKVVFYHGHSSKDGGWFDATKGKPRIQVRHERTAAWITVGELSAYPNTTNESAAGLTAGERFEFVLPKPEVVCAVRVAGVSAGGEEPLKAHASCAELEIFAD